MTDRKKVIDDLQDAVNDDWLWRHADYYALTMERAIALLKEQPEIVRCKDCKWYSLEISWCNNSMSPKEQTFFCADGKRKSADEILMKKMDADPLG